MDEWGSEEKMKKEGGNNKRKEGMKDWEEGKKEKKK